MYINTNAASLSSLCCWHQGYFIWYASSYLEFICHTWTVPSLLPDAIRKPSGDHASTLTCSVCAVYVNACLPVNASHTCTMGSSPADAIYIPSGDHAIALIPAPVS